MWFYGDMNNVSFICLNCSVSLCIRVALRELSFGLKPVAESNSALLLKSSFSSSGVGRPWLFK